MARSISRRDPKPARASTFCSFSSVDVFSINPASDLSKLSDWAGFCASFFSARFSERCSSRFSGRAGLPAFTGSDENQALAGLPVFGALSALRDLPDLSWWGCFTIVYCNAFTRCEIPHPHRRRDYRHCFHQYIGRRLSDQLQALAKALLRARVRLRLGLGLRVLVRALARYFRDLQTHLRHLQILQPELL